MKSKPLFLIALAAGLAAAVLVNLYLRERESAIGSVLPLMKAKHDVAAGSLVQEADFEPVDFPERHMDAFRDPKTKEGSLVVRGGEGGSFKHVVGQPLQRDVAAGEFLLVSHVAPPLGARLNLAIPDGRVGFTVPLDRATRSADLINPGDVVDVFAATTGGRPEGAELVVEGVTVLAVGNRVVADSPIGRPRDRAEASAVTLALTREQVAKLAGRVVHLALRGPSGK